MPCRTGWPRNERNPNVTSYPWCRYDSSLSATSSGLGGGATGLVPGAKRWERGDFQGRNRGRGGAAMSDRLRNPTDPECSPIVIVAESELATLRAENQRLREALEELNKPVMEA